MRRIPRPLPRNNDLWRFRVLGTIIPDLGIFIAMELEKLPSPSKPILSVRMRPALLAETAIVERTGAEMLRMRCVVTRYVTAGSRSLMPSRA